MFCNEYNFINTSLHVVSVANLAHLSQLDLLWLGIYSVDVNAGPVLAYSYIFLYLVVWGCSVALWCIATTIVLPALCWWLFPWVFSIVRLGLLFLGIDVGPSHGLFLYHLCIQPAKQGPVSQNY